MATPIIQLCHTKALFSPIVEYISRPLLVLTADVWRLSKAAKEIKVDLHYDNLLHFLQETAQ